jgi:hypothetical protein
VHYLAGDLPRATEPQPRVLRSRPRSQRQSLCRAIPDRPFPDSCQMGHSKVETTKNIYGHLFAWDRAAILEAMNQAVSRLYAYEKPDGEAEEIGV